MGFYTQRSQTGQERLDLGNFSLVLCRPPRAGQVGAVAAHHRQQVTAHRQRLHNVVMEAPAEPRDQLPHLARIELIRTCSAWHPRNTPGLRTIEPQPPVATANLGQEALPLGPHRE